MWLRLCQNTKIAIIGNRLLNLPSPKDGKGNNKKKNLHNNNHKRSNSKYKY